MLLFCTYTLLVRAIICAKDEHLGVVELAGSMRDCQTLKFNLLCLKLSDFVPRNVRTCW